MTLHVLFVCLGNICRSPTAHGILQHKVNEAALQEQIIIDSAGTAAWHLGKSSDARTQSFALARGYDLSELRARQVTPEDFNQYDYVLAMDDSNLADLQELAPENHQSHLGLFLEFTRQPEHQGDREVPDPYYGGDQGFQHVLDLVEDAAEGLFQELQHKLAEKR